MPGLIGHLVRARDDSLIAADRLSSIKGGLSTDQLLDIEQYLETAERSQRRLEQFSPRIVVKSEPLTYSKYSPNSFFADSIRAEQSTSAKQRLQRHADEMHVELRAREHSIENRSMPNVDFERRVNPNISPGEGGTFAPPLWLIEDFATAPRPGRILASLIARYPLPQGVSSINLPRVTTGTTAATAREISSVPSTDLTDAQVTSTTITIAGMADVALQLLEQSGLAGAALDQCVSKDLADSYDAQLETALINGTGGSGLGAQILGVLNVSAPAANSVTYTAASPTGSGIWPFFGQVVAQVGDNRLLPPECWLMRTSRWGWLTTSESTSGYPFGVSPTFIGQNDNSTPNPIGGLIGWPVFLSDAIPATLGTAANQDVIIAVRPSDMLLFEGTPSIGIFTEALSGSLGARIRLHNYVGALTGRYPTGVGNLQGTGLIVQSGF